MTERVASCQCGQLKAHVTGEAARISICHCLACQRRTGAPFGAQSRFPRDQVRQEGESRAWARTAESGNRIVQHFCPVCGATIWWELSGFPDLIAVPLGAFADPAYPPPAVCVWEATRHPWTDAIAALPLDRWEGAPEGRR
jgi:hypothetical protein